MKASVLVVLLFLFSSQASARSRDSAKAVLPQITYRGLDSLIHTNKYTAIYFWPSWCAACAPKLAPVLDVMRQNKQITFISVNDPESRSVVPTVLLQNADIVKGSYRIQRYGRQKLIEVNDKSQQRYFNWYYTKSVDMEEIEVLRRFLLFDQSGKLLYCNKGDFIDVSADSLSTILKAYQ